MLRILTRFISDGIVWTVLRSLVAPSHAFLSERPASAVIFIVLTLIITLLDRNLAFRLCVAPAGLLNEAGQFFTFISLPQETREGLSLLDPWSQQGSEKGSCDY